MSDQYTARSRRFLAALLAVGVLLCACRAPSLPPTPARQHSKPIAEPSSDQHPTSPDTEDSDEGSPSVAGMSAAAGGLVVLQQADHSETCLGASCESNPLPFLTLQTM